MDDLEIDRGGLSEDRGAATRVNKRFSSLCGVSALPCWYIGNFRVLPDRGEFAPTAVDESKQAAESSQPILNTWAPLELSTCDLEFNPAKSGEKGCNCGDPVNPRGGTSMF